MKYESLRYAGNDSFRNSILVESDDFINGLYKSVNGMKLDLKDFFHIHYDLRMHKDGMKIVQKGKFMGSMQSITQIIALEAAAYTAVNPNDKHTYIVQSIIDGKLAASIHPELPLTELMRNISSFMESLRSYKHEINSVVLEKIFFD